MPVMTHCCPPRTEHLPEAGQVICHCLQVTEGEVADAILTLGLTTLDEIRRCTGAGDGCTCCHRRLKQCIENYAPASSFALPICSDR